MVINEGTALVVLSGGQDSVTCLCWAVNHYATVLAVGFDYGQRHAVELNQARIICETMDIPFTVYSLPLLGQLGDSALVTNGDVSATHRLNADLPNSFVPGRNALMLTSAYAYALKVNADVIVTGTCQTDYSGYPDCRNEFVVALNDALNIGYLADVEIITPLMYLTKAETFQMAEDLGCLDTVIEYSHTCYVGNRTRRFDWGYGCGQCPACKLRAAGYDEFKKRQVTP